jgi:hypothetical protein
MAGEQPGASRRSFPAQSSANSLPELICLWIRRRCRRRRGRRRRIRRLHSEWNFFRDQHPSNDVRDFHDWKNQHAQNYRDDAGGCQVPSVAQRKGRTHTRHHAVGLRPIHRTQKRCREPRYVGRRPTRWTETRRCRQWLSTLVTKHNTTPLGDMRGVLGPFPDQSSRYAAFLTGMLRESPADVDPSSESRLSVPRSIARDISTSRADWRTIGSYAKASSMVPLAENFC